MLSSSSPQAAQQHQLPWTKAAGTRCRGHAAATPLPPPTSVTTYKSLSDTQVFPPPCPTQTLLPDRTLHAKPETNAARKLPDPPGAEVAPQAASPGPRAAAQGRLLSLKSITATEVSPGGKLSPPSPPRATTGGNISVSSSHQVSKPLPAAPEQEGNRLHHTCKWPFLMEGC